VALIVDASVPGKSRVSFLFVTRENYMNFTQIGQEVANNGVYTERVEYALYVAAVNVMGEVNTTPNHAARVTFASKVLGGQANIRAAVLLSLTASVTSQAANADAIADADLQTVITSDFNALAGIGT
jgi:hypothetical protein